ncbi:unnamed protein product [Lasius platythorax]|uniref:OB domain-containing protein n=1 Tax=Lasius platythorax TaxID=488582 RepID=A0AAV2P0R1_9HYME
MDIPERIRSELDEEDVNDLLTPSETLDNIQLNDYTIEIIGYVQNTKPICAESYFKFFLNNNDGKLVSIVVWNRNIDRIQHHIKTNHIIYLDGVKAKAKYGNNGNVPYELHVRDNTVVYNLGLMPDNMPEYTELSKALMTSRRIVLKGYIKTNFAKYYGNDYEIPKGRHEFGCGSITDGTYKLEVHAQKFDQDNYIQLNLGKGDKIEIKGTMKAYEKDRPPYLSIDNLEDIKKLNGHMSIASLLRGVQKLCIKNK